VILSAVQARIISYCIFIESTCNTIEDENNNDNNDMIFVQCKLKMLKRNTIKLSANYDNIIRNLLTSPYAYNGYEVIIDIIRQNLITTENSLRVTLRITINEDTAETSVSVPLFKQVNESILTIDNVNDIVSCHGNGNPPSISNVSYYINGIWITVNESLLNVNSSMDEAKCISTNTIKGKTYTVSSNRISLHYIRSRFASYFMFITIIIILIVIIIILIICTKYYCCKKSKPNAESVNLMSTGTELTEIRSTVSLNPKKS